MKRVFLSLAVAALVSGCKHKFYIPDDAMSPAIPRRSHVTVDVRAYEHTAVRPARYDIVAFKARGAWDGAYVFRVVGLPGEHLQLWHNGVAVDGEKLELPDGLAYARLDGVPRAIYDIQLGPYEYFVLGDNTATARDSRVKGPVAEADIIGKVDEIYLPMSAGSIVTP